MWSCHASRLIPFNFSTGYDHQRKSAKHETRLIKKLLQVLTASPFFMLSLAVPTSSIFHISIAILTTDIP